MKYKIQNMNYFRMMKCKMPKVLELCLIPSKIYNFIVLIWPLEALLDFFLPLEAKI